MLDNYEVRHVSGGLYLTRPKLKAGWRIVPLYDSLKTILKETYREHATERVGLAFAGEHADFETVTPPDLDQITA